MTKQDFKELQLKFNNSGMTLKAFLGQEGVAYSTYNYWSNKARTESEPLPVAPISIREPESCHAGEARLADITLPGVTLAFPNGVRAHFGSGSESVLMDVLTKSMGHVLP